ncbi:hypothetical protein BJV74DRAFT_884401 [Russula compacta]|nr:hypothetical protein BJV74DRAFT_884401 [Russula compacta]
MSSYSSDASRSGTRSPLFGTATFSTLTQSESVPTRYSYSSRSGETTSFLEDVIESLFLMSTLERATLYKIPLSLFVSRGGISSDDSDIPGGDMRRVTISPSPPNRHPGSDLHSWSEDDSIQDDAEVEAALSALDNELDRTEDALTEWSRESSVTPSSYLSGSASSPSVSTTSSIYIPFTNTLRDARILSTITERTENPSSRPTSYNLSVPGSRPISDAVRRSTVSLHSRGITEPGPSAATSGRRTGDLIAYFEDKSSSDSSSRPYSPYGHRRTGSVPAGPRSPSPYTQTSQSIPTFATTTYGHGSSNSRPSSPSKSWASQSQSHTSGTPSRSLLSPPSRSITTDFDSGLASPYMSSEMPTYSNTFTSTSYRATDTSATTPVASLRRPQKSPRSPLTSVRNIVAAWKSRSPSIDKSSQVGSGISSTDVTPDEGFFSIRRRAGRGPGTSRRSGPSHDQEDVNIPSTPRTNTSLTPSGIVPPPFDLTELGTFAKGSQEPLRIGLLWYLNVHAPPPYRWQRCQAVLYPNMLLLSWIAQGGGRGIVTLDLLNCTEVRSVASPTHPSAQDDVGTIAAKAQTANAQAEGFGALGLIETLCPFQLFYSDGVERLGAESARERVRWVSAIWEVLDRSVTVPDRSETQSPTGSMHTIRSMASTSTHSGSGVSGSRSTTFVPPMDTIPDLSDFQSLSGSSTGTLSRQPSLRSRAADDAAISNQTLVYPGDPRVIAPSRSSSLRRTTSMTDLDEEFESALRRAKDARPGLGFGLGLTSAIIGEGLPVTVSSGPTLRRDIIVTPPPTAGRSVARVRAVGSESVASVSDEAFFSSGGRSAAEQSTFRSLSSTQSGTNPTTSTIEDTSGSGTVVPPTNREGTSYLGSSADDGHSISDLPSRVTGLTRSRAVRSRRDAGSSISYSSLSAVESSSDKENTNHNPSRSYSEYSRTDEFSTMESYSRSTGTRSANGTPLPSSSSEHSSRSEEHPSTTDTPTNSTPYETARSPSIMSFASLPSIPSLYETAEVCSTESEATKSVPSEDFITAKASPKVESVSDYITAPVCESEVTSPFTTAEVCPTEASTEYDDAECRCKLERDVISEGIQVAVPEPVERIIAQPVEEIFPQPAEEETQIPEPEPEPVVTVEPIPEPRVIFIDPEFPPYPQDDLSAISSPSEIESIPTVSTTRIARAISLPGSVSSPSVLSTELPSERPAVMPLRPVPSVSSISSIPLPLPGPSPIGPPDSLPTTSLLSSVTESTPSSITPSRRTASTPRVPSSPTMSHLWAPETDDSYESSVLRASPSVQSIAFPEGPDISFDTSFLRPTASAYTSQEPSRLSTIDESPSSESPSITYSSSSSPSLTPTATVSVSVSPSATPSSPSLSPTVPSPSLQVPSSTTVVTPIHSPERPPVALTRTPSTVSSISMRTDILDNRSLFEEPVLEDVSTEPSLLSTHMSSAPRAVGFLPAVCDEAYVTLQISPARIPLPRSPSLLSTPTASPSVSITSPRGSIPSIHSDLVTIPSERSLSERPSVIITDDINRLLQYLHGLENDRQRDNQGIHGHLGDIQDELRNLAEYIREKEATAPMLPPVQLKDRSVGGGSIVSWREPRGAPDYSPTPPAVTSKASPGLVPIPLTPPPRSPRSPSSLSSSISFLSSHHSDDLSLMEYQPFIQEPSSPISSTPTSISSSPPSSSIPSSPSSSPSSRTLPLTPISQSPPSSGEYLSRTSTDVTQRVFPTSVSPTPSIVSSATVRPVAPGIDREALNRIREVLDAVKAQTDDLQDGQSSTNRLLNELRDRCPLPQDNTELVERLQRLEDLINRLADAQRRARAATPEESLFDSGSDTSTAIRRLRERWERMRRETPTLSAPTPLRPRTSLDDMMAELLRPPQPPASVQIQPPPAFVPLNFRPDARGPRPRSASPTLLTELPQRPYTVPFGEPPFVTRDLGRRRPSRPVRVPRPAGQFPPLQPPLQPSETPVTVTRPDIGRRPQRVDDTGPDFLDGVHQLRGRRPSAPRDGWVHSRHDAEPAAPSQPVVQADAGRATAPAVLETGPWYQAAPPPPPGPGPMPPVGQPGVVPPIPPPFTQSVILPPIFNDMMAMVRENRFMHLASLEQQRELMRYMNSLNEWLGHDVEDRQAELRGISARIDQLRDDLSHLGLPRGPFPPPGPGPEPGFMMPGVPGAPGTLGIPGRTGTVPPSGTFVPPPPQVSFPQPSQPYPVGVVPAVVPQPIGYRTPSPSSVVYPYPSPVIRDGGRPFVPPDLGPSRRESLAIPPEEYTSLLFLTESPRSPSLAPVLVPGPQIVPQQPVPPVLVYPPTSQPPTRPTRTPSVEFDREFDRSRTSSPPFLAPAAGQPTIVNIPPQPVVAPAIPLAPTQPDRDDQTFLPPIFAQPPTQILPSPRPEPSEYDGRREAPGPPIIIQPPAQPLAPPGTFGPMVPPIIPGAPPRSPRSFTPTISTRSPRTPEFATAFPLGPSGPMPMPAPGMIGVQPMPPPTVFAPSRRASPEYRSPTRESARIFPVPSRAPSRYTEPPIQPIQPFQPFPPTVPIPTAIHIEPQPFRGRTRYSESRTPSSERDRSDSRERRRRRRRRRDRSVTPSSEERERPRDRRRSPYRSRSPSTVYPAPVGVGPVYDRGVGPPVVPAPAAVTHIHTYPPPSPTVLTELTEPRTEPLPVPFGQPTQFPPEQVPMPVGFPTSSRRSRAPTIVEVTGPEPIHILPPDQGRPRTESTPYQPPISGPVSGVFREEGRPRSPTFGRARSPTFERARSPAFERARSPTFESQVRSASPSTPFIPVLPSEVSRHPAPAPRPVPPPIARSEMGPEEIPEPETFGHIRPRSLTPPSEESLGEIPRGIPDMEVPGAPTTRGVPEPETQGRIRPRSLTPSLEESLGEIPRGIPDMDVPVPGAPTTRGVPEPETQGHIRAMTPSSEGLPPEEARELSRDAPVPGLSRAPTARDGPDVTPRLPSGPGRLDYDDAERERHERFGEIERQLADVTQGAAEAEMRREHDFQEKEAERERQFAETQARREELLSTLARQPVPPAGAPLPAEVLGVPERAESVIASIRRASTESAARHADDIRDIVQGEREEMARQLQEEREQARAARDALEQQVLAERKRGDDERDARMRELEEELTRVRAELDHERQQRDHDEEMRREAESERNLERDAEMRQQLSEITDLLLAHREEFARKKETVDERWKDKLEWRDETNRQFQGLFNMVQSVLDCCEEEKARYEEEQRAAAERPSTQDVLDELQRLRELFETLTNSWHEETERHHRELLDTVQSTANVQVPFNVQGYLDEFSKSLASEVRMLLGEVGKLREERRTIQLEIGTLLCLRSNYQGGLFDSDWKPTTGPLAPQPPGDLPPDEPSAPPPEPRQGAWRTLPPRGGMRRFRKKSEPRPAGPVAETTPPAAPPPDRAQTTGSWATWQGLPADYTPPPTEPTIHLAPEVAQPQRGLFGPRSPRSS